ncbi:acriflavin resistance protein [Salimicrobium jeotgali]|uniref:Acriflavin resistance protein n=1 Tax=Salimicrobium jeotgali TaxID=1230341 RepID=K2G8C8_9BACI|nr:efflux RND transporter permease subunit [Salimicrobium jeotgali]AKG03745.1 acriflavin resistance protein [Salimicrobium jeotgali]EKE31398.1 acriflavin resistance protein family transporter subunit AcrB [Salimicrobium jeotgali]MBM7697007.1 HAE1 family hydrophobic/amphiphilic exporter-1 [Salimicrobium jeotgali]
MKLVRTSIKRPVGVIMIVAAILALGFVSLRNLTIDLYPDIDLPVAVVSTSYEEAAPQDVEQLVSRPIEGAVSSLEGLEVLQSQSQQGASLIFMQFSTGVDLDSALLEVREAVSRVSGVLPENAGEPSVLRFDPQALPIMTIGLSGDTPAELQQIAEDQIVPYLERQGGVASISVEGGRTEEVQIEIEREKLARLGIDSQTIIQTLNASNQAATAGSVDKGDKNLRIRVNGEFDSIDDVKNTVLTTESGDRLKLDQIAMVEKRIEDTGTVSEVNGETAVVLSALKKTDANTVETAENIQTAMDEVAPELPENVEMKTVLDTSEFIKVSINSVIVNIIIGGLFAVAVLLLFLKSIRATLVIGISIPIAIISTFTLMYFTGETLNVLTMGGLALGIGMMVDSSIVILENIVSYRQRGFSMKEAAEKGASELAPAVIASATTTLVVFLPIMLVDGIASELFTPLALTISFALLASLAVSVTLIPMLSSKLLTKAMRDGKRNWFDRLLGKMNRGYQRVLRKVLKFRKTTVLLTILSIGGSIALIPLVGTSFIPESDQGQIEVDVSLERGTSLEETETVTSEISKRLNEFSDVVDVHYLSIGSGEMGLAGGSADRASYTVQLVDPGDRERSTQEVMEDMENDLSDVVGAEVEVTEMSAGLGTGAPLEVQINGQDNAVLNELAEQIVLIMKDVEGVVAPSSSTEDSEPQLDIQVDRNKASGYGLTEQQVISQVQLAFQGQTATRYREGGEELEVRLVTPLDESAGIAELEGTPISTASGDTVPLSSIAEIEQVQGPVALNRENQQPQVNVTADIGERDLGSVTADVEEEIDQLNFPEGYTYEVGGQAQDMEEAFGDLSVALLFSLFLVYAVMAVQFENFLFPFIIMFSLPATVVGVAVGLFVTGLPLSMPAFVGIIMLAGIVVNNAIVLVDYINILRRRSYSRYDAILEAGPNRLRPILMTTVTTVLGMVPLALGIGQGAEAQQPLAVTIIFGLTVSSFFTLVLIPVVYTYFDDLSVKINKFFQKRVE